MHPERATRWTLRTRTLELPNRPLVMGIVNVTPDSFSDGGRYLEPQVAVDHALQLAAEGADLIDIGGESTRPCAERVPDDEEFRRVLPVMESVCRQANVPVSIDTSKAAVALAAIEAGAEIVNDVTALRGDPRMLDLVRETGVGVCAMHMRGTPQTMQDNPTYTDVVQEVLDFLRSGATVWKPPALIENEFASIPALGLEKPTNTIWR